MKVWFEAELGLNESAVVDSENEPKILWLDIETRKVAVPSNWHQRLRWQPFMVGLIEAADPGVLTVEVVSGEESELIEYLSMRLEGSETRYAATREFDEMVLRGRFTNARRTHSPYAGEWPNLNGEAIEWRNVRKSHRRVSPQAFRDVQTFGVDGYRYDSRVGCDERAPRAAVPRILNPDSVPRIDEDARR